MVALLPLMWVKFKLPSGTANGQSQTLGAGAEAPADAGSG